MTQAIHTSLATPSSHCALHCRHCTRFCARKATLLTSMPAPHGLSKSRPARSSEPALSGQQIMHQRILHTLLTPAVISPVSASR
eukprot:6926637-Karenia_brevis.AAC.1